MSPEAELPPYVHHCVPNRSLGAQGRRWFLAALIATAFAVATLATIFGAWPVMPFAGLEVMLVLLAFHVVRAHDADFERLEIGEHEVRIVPLGRLLSDEGRRRLAGELRGRIAVTAN
jgi:uncharacterized membrane protein